MRGRKRAIAETLVILASAIIFFLLLSSGPSKASGGGTPPPPIEEPPSNPIPDESLPPQPNPSSPPAQSGNAEQQAGSQPAVIEETAPQEESGQAQLPPDDQATAPPTTGGSSSDEPSPSGIPSSNPLNGAASNSSASASELSEVDPATAPKSSGGTADESTFPDDDQQPAGDDLCVAAGELPDLPDKLSELYPAMNSTDGALGLPDETEHVQTVEPMGAPEEEDDRPAEPSAVEHPEQRSAETQGNSDSEHRAARIEVRAHLDRVIENPLTHFLLGMYTRLDTTGDLHGIRKRLYEFIKSHPGEHLSTLMKEFRLSPSSISHHLNVLHKNGFIIFHSDGRYKRLFVNNNGYISSLNGNYKGMISAMKNDNARKVILLLLAKPMSTQFELSQLLDLHSSTIHWHTNKLQECGMLVSIRDGKNIRYAVVDPGCVLKVLSIAETVVL